MVQSFVSFCVNTSVRDFRHHKVNIVKQPIQNRFISLSARLEMASVIAIVIKIGSHINCHNVKPGFTYTCITGILLFLSCRC